MYPVIQAGSPDANSEMETGVQKVYWGVLLGSTPGEEGEGREGNNRGREKLGCNVVTRRASADPQGELKLAS